MKKTILLVSGMCMLSFACSKNQPLLDEKLYAELCISPDKYQLPVKQLEYKNKNAVIKYGTGVSNAYFWYIQIEGNEKQLFSPCAFPEAFKCDGMKVIISATSYSLNCKSGIPCGAGANTPIVIAEIKQRE
ncbi:hypothetical protein [Emticicia sp. 21SJ11W-3]|uniref:hypothetical protein n=1 Tax=Emticicia sp. 21SJ11W-3 TaxID=2916755 RepID=UPI00209FE621|nr:hypothetical protein [Emticicia sp. 21SJ11W-3]UTA68132.1 hypothetical protein MB380_21430 [Emticicia sp. 21SJ11W-3]